MINVKLFTGEWILNWIFTNSPTTLVSGPIHVHVVASIIEQLVMNDYGTQRKEQQNIVRFINVSSSGNQQTVVFFYYLLIPSKRNKKRKLPFSDTLSCRFQELHGLFCEWILKQVNNRMFKINAIYLSLWAGQGKECNNTSAGKGEKITVFIFI